MTREIDKQIHNMLDINNVMLSFNEVIKITNIARSTLYLMIERGDFPKPIKITKHRNKWHIDTIKTWLNNKGINLSKDNHLTENEIINMKEIISEFIKQIIIINNKIDTITILLNKISPSSTIDSAVDL